MQSTPRTAPATAPTMTLGDIYYILFRNKWKILLCSLAGFAGAAGVYVLNPPPFISESKLFIRYVLTENSAPTPGDGASVKSPDQRGETIMDSETEILTSLDLSKQVAEAVGPERILAKAGGGKDLNQAALMINHGLQVEVPPRSSVIHIIFSHPDFEVVQPVLRELTERYLKMHMDIHRAVGMVGESLLQETDTLRARLAQTEEELRRARAKAGVVSIEETKATLTTQLAKLQDEMYAAEAELAERGSVLKELTKGAASAAPSDTPEQPVPVPKVNEYRSVASRLELLRRREQEMLSQFTPENQRVKDVQTQIGETENAKKKLEKEFPSLARTNPVPSSTGGSSFDVVTETAKLNAIQAKIKVISEQMAAIRSQAAAIDQVEGSIQELKRKKELEEANYRYYAQKLEQARINEALGSGKVSNISPIQNPTPPFIDRKKTLKLMAGIAVAGIALGLAWSFATELYLDRSIRRPLDVERHLGVPLFLSIPVIGKTGKLRKVKNVSRQLELEAGGNNTALVSVKTKDEPDLGSAASSLVLNTFHETLRDRLISYFESVNLTHKPKLVAVTGLGQGSGVTTTAAGLARSLSETGEGNVLLVDMTAGQGSAQQFYRGKDVVGLDEILSTRDDAKMEDKLYVVAEEPSREKLSRILPQRFTKLVPKLKASNFDYIIFDMPAVSQISITPRLAGFMDMVLLVVESEKTDRDLVQRATNLLAQSNAHVGAVLNKTKSYVPSALHQEYLGNG